MLPKDLIERKDPWDHEAERRLLARLVRFPMDRLLAAMILDPVDLEVVEHRRIFEELVEQPMNSGSLWMELDSVFRDEGDERTAAVAEEIDGADYPLSFSEALKAALYVRDLSFLRRLRGQVLRSQYDALTGGTPVADSSTREAQ